VADRDAHPELAKEVQKNGGVVINVGKEAEDAARGRGSEPLQEHIAAVFAPLALNEIRLYQGGRVMKMGPLRAGEEITWQGLLASKHFEVRYGRKRVKTSLPPKTIASTLGDQIIRTALPNTAQTVLAAIDPQDIGSHRYSQQPPLNNPHKCDNRGPAFRYSGVSSDLNPVALAEERPCTKSTPPPQTEGSKPGLGMPKSPLLSMLRKRIIPIARGCFRRDRAGRLDYKVRAEFHFRLAEREVVSAYIKGRIKERLRKCLLSAVDALDVPYFSGNVIVRYPLVTESEPLPEQIELSTEAAREVDSIIKVDHD